MSSQMTVHSRGEPLKSSILKYNSLDGTWSVSIMDSKESWRVTIFDLSEVEAKAIQAAALVGKGQADEC